MNRIVFNSQILSKSLLEVVIRAEVGCLDECEVLTAVWQSGLLPASLPCTVGSDSMVIKYLLTSSFSFLSLFFLSSVSPFPDSSTWSGVFPCRTMRGSLTFWLWYYWPSHCFSLTTSWAAAFHLDFRAKLCLGPAWILTSLLSFALCKELFMKCWGLLCGLVPEVLRATEMSNYSRLLPGKNFGNRIVHNWVCARGTLQGVGFKDTFLCF